MFFRKGGLKFENDHGKNSALFLTTSPITSTISVKKETTMKFETSTAIIPMLYVGMYDSCLSPNSVFSYEFEDEENKDRDFDEEWDRFDYTSYKTAVGKKAAAIAERIANEYLNGKNGIKAVTSNEDILSPKDYNFETDVLSIDVEMEEDFMEVLQSNFKKWEEENGAVAKWVKDHYTSYDGFWSAIPNSLAEIASNIADGIDLDRLIGVYACLCLVDSGYFKDNEWEESEYGQNNAELIEEVEENLCFDKFLTE